MAKGSKPSFIARAKKDEKGEYMQTIGAAWDFKEGEGLVVNLHAVPTHWDGTFILVPPKED